MNGRRVIKKATRTLFITIFWIGLFVGVGIGTYHLTLTYYKSTGQYASSTSDNANTIVKATTDDVAVNAIFAVDGNDGKVKHLLLEIFHSKKGKFNFLTIPTDSQYNMSKELYASINKDNPNVPQIMTWEDLPQYFSQITTYQYASMILEESLGIHISFYTLMSETTFQDYFEEAQATSLDGFNDTRGFTLSEATRNRMKGLTTSLQMEKELAVYYTKIQSNLSLSRRNIYLSAYQKADYEGIGVYTLSIAKDTKQITTEDRAYLRKLVED